MGHILVGPDDPQKSHMEVVLGGDGTGNRIMKACELIRSGYAPRALVSGGGNFYGTHESVLAIQFATSKGCAADYFISVPFQATSTFDDAQHVIEESSQAGAPGRTLAEFALMLFVVAAF